MKAKPTQKKQFIEITLSGQPLHTERLPPTILVF